MKDAGQGRPTTWRPSDGS